MYIHCITALIIINKSKFVFTRINTLNMHSPVIIRLLVVNVTFNNISILSVYYKSLVVETGVVAL